MEITPAQKYLENPEIRVENYDTKGGRKGPRGLSRYNTVDEFEYHELDRPQLAPLNWEHLKNCDPLLEGGHQSQRASLDYSCGVDIPFLHIEQEVEGVVRVKWMNKLMNNQKAAVSRKLSRAYEGRGKQSEQVIVRSEDVDISLRNYDLYVTGTEFKDDCDSVRSCSVLDDGSQRNIIQHMWQFPGTQQMTTLACLGSGSKFKFRLVALYDVTVKVEKDTKKFTEKVHSVNKFFITIGRPPKPNIRISDLDPLQVTLTWSLIETHPKVDIRGYLVSVNNRAKEVEFGPKVRFPTISDLNPDSMQELRVKVLSNHVSGDSEFSEPIRVRVPKRPLKPKLEVMPIVDIGKITIRWQLGVAEQEYERVKWASLYIAHNDNKPALYQKVAVDSDVMFYTFQDLNLSDRYTCTVQMHAGTNAVSSSGLFGVCEILSEMSNAVQFEVCAPPIPGGVSLVYFDDSGFNIKWQDPIEFGDARVTGYQPVKDGVPYGPVLSPDVRSATIKQVVPGGFYQVQLIALSDHAVCRKPFIIEGYTSTQYFMRVTTNSKLETSEQRKLHGLMMKTKRVSKYSRGVQGYEGCLPGKSIVAGYTGLVRAPRDVTAVTIRGSSATIQWTMQHPDADDPEDIHYKRATHCRVYWWIEDSEEMFEDDTDLQQITLSFLKPHARYLVAVEARRVEETDLGPLLKKCLSKVTSFDTGSPPGKPSNVKVIKSSPRSITLSWVPPVVSGYKLMGYRVQARETLDGTRDFEGCDNVSFNIGPESTTFKLTGLRATSMWKLTLMVVSDRFFEACEDPQLKESENIPLHLKFEEIHNFWLPYVTLSASTLPLNDPKTIVVTRRKPNSVMLKWAAWGNSEEEMIESQTLWYTEYSDVGAASKYYDEITLEPTLRCFTLDSLEPATIYQIKLEATVTKRISEDKENHSGSQTPESPFTSKHIYDTLMMRTPAPVKTGDLLVTGYTPNNITVAWAKPSLHRNPEDMFATKIIHRSLEEYRVVINGKTYQAVEATQQIAILTKCQPGKTYHLVLSITTSTCHPFKDKELMQKFGRSLDYSYTLPMTIQLPELHQGCVQSFDCDYVKRSKEGDNECGYVKVRWSLFRNDPTLSNSDMGVDHFEAVWETDDNPNQVYSVSVANTDGWVLLPVEQFGDSFKIFMMVMFNNGRDPEVSQALTYETPGVAFKPSLTIHHVSTNFFIIEWLQEEARGINQTAGFQTFVNGKKAGNVLEPEFFKAKIASKMYKEYEVRLQALSSHPDMPPSELSDALFVSTDEHTVELYKQMFIDLRGMALVEGHSWESTRSVAPGTEFDRRRGEIKLALRELTEAVMAFRIADLDSASVSQVKVEWNSFESNETRQLVLPAEQELVSLETFGGGINHFVRFSGLGEHGQVVAKSRQITVLSAKKLEPPTLRQKRVTFAGLTVTWSSERDLQELIFGYRLYVNGREVTEVNNSVTEYTFTQGLMCREYKFEVKALAHHEHLDSRSSAPLVILWPGIITPVIDEVMATTGNAIKIAWIEPFATQDVKILGYWIYCKLIEEDHEDSNPDKRITIGPLPSETTSYQLENLSTVCLYEIHIELKIAGLDLFLESNHLTLQPVKFPYAPSIKLHLQGMRERPQIESELSRQIRQWWEMLGLDDSMIASRSSEEPQAITDFFRKMEPSLTKLAQFTGKIEGELTWRKLDSAEDENITGFKVFINGSQVGNDLPKSQRRYTFKLSMGKPSYSLCIASVVENSTYPLQKSNQIDIESHSFKPFAVFCYFKVHNRAARWPNRGCCSASDMLNHEVVASNEKFRRTVTSSLPGTLEDPKPCPNPLVYRVIHKKDTLLLSAFTNSNNLRSKFGVLVVFFYTYWCLSSQSMLRFLSSWASVNDTQAKVITFCVNSSDPPPETHYANVASLIKGESWSGDNIQHVCGCFSLSSGVNLSRDNADESAEKTDQEKQNMHATSSKRVLEMFSLIGVPTLCVISEQTKNILWQGRLVSSNAEDFTTSLNDILAYLPK